MGGERVESAQVDENGVVGDRAFVVYDSAGRLVTAKSNKRVRHMAGLLEFEAVTLDGVVIIRFPDGRVFNAGDPAADEALSAMCGTRVTMLGNKNMSHRDAAPLHILSEAAIRPLRLFLPDRSINTRRFRPNFVIASSAEAPPEAEWVGRIIGIGPDVRIRVTRRTVRGITVALANAELPREPAILRVLADHSEGCLGVFAEVTRPGAVHRADEVYFVENETEEALESEGGVQVLLAPPHHSEWTDDRYIFLTSIARRFPLLRVYCERCGLHSLYRTKKLIENYGTEPHVAVMREAITAQCPRQCGPATEPGDGCAPVLLDLPGYL
jgi:hypothetical protein